MTCESTVLTSLTPQDFKDYFFRDFTFVDDYNASTTYNTGNLVFYTTDNKIYKCLTDGVIGIAPDSDPAKWELQTDISNYIVDKDIEKAYEQACINFPEHLFSDDDMKVAYLYLTAHYLVKDLGEGGLDSTGDQLLSSVKVGNVSETYKIPEWMTQDKIYSYYTTTSYGLKYLNLIIPYLVGNVQSVGGQTHA
jgi:hypothetical protein